MARDHREGNRETCRNRSHCTRTREARHHCRSAGEVRVAGHPHVGVTLDPSGDDIDLVWLYLKEIGQFPLLSKDDEVRLAQQIARGKAAREQLANDAEL